MEHQEKIRKLFSRYVTNQCSPDEVSLLLQYFNAAENESLLKELIGKEIEMSENTEEDKNPEAIAQLESIFQKLKQELKKKKK